MTDRLCYAFEEGVDLDLVPLAARRALDAAGTKVSLEAWRSLPLERRQAIARSGVEDRVDVGRVRASLAELASERWVGRAEPDALQPPAELTELLARGGVAPERWPTLRALDRWSLAMLFARGKLETLAKLIEELRQRDGLSRPPPAG